MYGDKGEVPDGEYVIPLGVADIKREGGCYDCFFGKIIKEAHMLLTNYKRRKEFRNYRFENRTSYGL
jgi:pyruvate/2-oxoglutarate/acetoin dehydrogenase E1 component